MGSFTTGFEWIAEHPWAYPLLEAMHITGIGLLFGNLVLFELRLWGAGRAIALPALARLALPLALAGFALAAATGLLMFASQAAELLANRAFVIKLGLLMVVGLNAAAFHARDGLRKADALARVQTALSLGLWLAIIATGRWIAYV
jgi:hypothetical protein